MEYQSSELKLAASFLEDAVEKSRGIRGIGHVESRRSFVESLHANEFKQAFKHIDRAGKSDASAEEIRNARAYAYKCAGNADLEFAMGDYDRKSSELLLASGFLDGAIKKYRKALELDDSDALLYYNLGSAFWGRERRLEAKEMFQKSLVLAEAEGNDELVMDVHKRLSVLDSDTKSISIGGSELDIKNILKGVAFIIVGILLIPFLIGIPMVGVGAWWIYRAVGRK